MINYEEQMQADVFQWAEWQSKKHPELAYMFHIPNGGYRHKATAARMKRAGQKAGVPDIFLPASRGAKHGLFIELKAGKNKPTEKQKEYITFLNEQGYVAAVCFSFDETINVILNYLGSK